MNQSEFEESTGLKADSVSVTSMQHMQSKAPSIKPTHSSWQLSHTNDGEAVYYAESGQLSKSSDSEPVVAQRKTQSVRDQLFYKKISAAMDGDNEAFGQIAVEFWNYLVFVADQYHSPNLRSKFGASDIVQMSFMEARETLPDFRGKSTDEFRGWLRKIVVNNARDEARRYSETKCRDNSREVSLSGEVDLDVRSETPLDEIDRAETNERIQIAIQNLSPQERKVIEARHHQDHQYDQIAGDLKIPKSTVRKIRFRALQKLKSWFRTSD